MENRVRTLVLVLAIAAAAACGGGGSGAPADAGVLPDASPPPVDTGSPWSDLGPVDVPAPPADVPDVLPPPADVADVVLAPDVTAIDARADLPPDVPPPDVFVPGSVRIVVGGASDHRILLEPGASPSEQTAAEELRSHILESTGVDLPVVVADPENMPAEDVPLIVLGQGPVARGPAALGEQGFVVRTNAPHVVIAGTAAAGTLYGVHRFLEDFVGVRWYAPGVTQVPQRAVLIVPPTDIVERPAFLWRHTSYAWPGGDDAFFARQGRNAGDRDATHPWGVQHRHDGRAHSYFRFVSPNEFFDEHPEYFSEVGGVRLRDETQLCLTNPDVLEIVTERMLARMANDPNARQHNFSQQDHYNYCTCPSCRAMNELYGSTGGTQFWFVSQLAERTSQVYPDKLIGTLAYMYTEEAPVGLDMHPNTAVWLCHMFPSCDSHPIADCPRDANYKRRALAWSALTEHLYIWHYIVDFMHYYNPFPNFRAMAADLRFYRDIGVEGIYLQAMGHGGGGGEWSLLRPWYGMKLLWDPDQDGDALLRDFLHGVYGPASTPLWDYVRLLHDEVFRRDIHMHLYTNPAQGYLTDEVIAQSEALFDEALAAVGDDAELRERVKVAHMPLVYARMFPRNGYDIADGMLRWRGEPATMPEVTTFLDRMDAHGFTTVREVSGGTETIMMAYLLTGVDQPVSTIDNGHLRVDVVPTLGGRALRITHLASGETVTAHDVAPNLYFPFAGGLEDRVGETFRFFGWVEPANVLALTESSITLESETFDGWKLSRTMTLVQGAPILRVVSTITNPGEGTRDGRLRSHLELDLGDVHETRVAFTALDGATIDQGTGGIIANQREGEHFYDQDAPAGEWRFTGPKGLELIQRIDNAEIDFTWLYAYPDTLNELEIELWGHDVAIGPGESSSLHQELEIRPARD